MPFGRMVGGLLFFYYKRKKGCGFMYGMDFMNYQPYPQNPAVRPPMR